MATKKKPAPVAAAAGAAAPAPKLERAELDALRAEALHGDHRAALAALIERIGAGS